MTVKELIRNDNRVRFMFYRSGLLWYEVIEAIQPSSDGTRRGESCGWKSIFQFPVPVDDCGEGKFLAEDKAITYMRYIRKQVESAEAEEKAFGQLARISGK